MPAQTKDTLKGYFNDGDVPNESNYIDVIDSFLLESGLPTFKGCRVERSSVNINNGTWTVIGFDTETYDVGGFHDNATNNSRLIAPLAGYYHIIGTVSFGANSVGERLITISKNGSSNITHFWSPPCPGQNTILNLSGDIYLAATDYAELSVWQSSGGVLSVSGAQFMIHKIG